MEEPKLIDANALSTDLIEKGFYPVIVRRAIERAPAVDAVPVVHGRWITGSELAKSGISWGSIIKNKDRHFCSACKEKASCDHDSCGYDAEEYLTDYCPNCGADMRGGENG